MINTKVYFKKYLSGLLVLIFICTSGLFAQNKSKKERITVGYYENEIFQEGASPTSVKTGYSYEYLQKVASYTGWHYEYIYGSWNNLYEDFMAGKIDLLAGLAYSENRLSVMSFPDFPMGYEKYFIFISVDNDDITVDPETLRGKTIGTLSGLMETIIENWLKERNVEAKIKVYHDVYDRDTAIERGEVDAFIGETASVRAKRNIKPLLKIGDTSMYLCVAKNRPDLLKELNQALASIDLDDPYYVQDLTKKYFLENSVSRTLSENEKHWLNDHDGKIKIGYFCDYLPYSARAEDGSANGIVTDVLERILLNLNLEDSVKIQYLGYDDATEMEKGLFQGKVDAIFPVTDHVWFLEQAGVFQSKQVISSTPELVYKGNLKNLKSDIIAVNSHNKVQTEYTMTYYPDSHIIYYDSIDGCLKAVENGSADSTILAGLRAKDLLSKSAYSNLKSITLPNADTKCFGVSAQNIALLSLLDRGINSLEPGFALSATYHYIKSNEYTVTDFIQDNILFFSLIFLTIAVLIFSCITIFVTKSRKQKVLRRLSLMDSMTSLGNRRAYEQELEKHSPFPGEKDFVYIGLDLNCLKATNDTYGHTAGDELIEGAAFCLKKAFTNEKRIYRIGGDEFCVILNESKQNVLEQLKEFERLEKNWCGTYSQCLSVSYGAVFLEESPGESLLDIIKEADRRMYRCKSQWYKESGMDRRK